MEHVIIAVVPGAHVPVAVPGAHGNEHTNALCFPRALWRWSASAWRLPIRDSRGNTFENSSIFLSLYRLKRIAIIMSYALGKVSAHTIDDCSQ